MGSKIFKPTLVWFVAMASLGAPFSYAQDEMYEAASKQCFSLIRDEYPTKRIYLNTHDRIGFTGDHRYFMSGRCFEPVCSDPFSWFVYQVRYIEGRKAYITCTMKDAGEPILDRYNDQNRFMPPG